jgi:hypothetical protein
MKYLQNPWVEKEARKLIKFERILHADKNNLNPLQNAMIFNLCYHISCGKTLDG